MNIQRYDPAVHDDRDEHGVNYFAEMEPDPSGEWVRFSDVHAERAKFAAFADEKGEPRRVLGTLPLTVEGDIIGDGAWCWFIFPGVLGKDDDKPARAMYRAMPIVDPDAYSGTRRVHSTKQAAEAAAGVKP